MAGQLRSTQHRPNKESKDISKKDYAELRRENQQLKKKLARAEKELLKLSHILYQQPQDDEVILPETKEPEVEKCPKCNSTKLKVLKLGLKDYRICTECKFREPVAA